MKKLITATPLILGGSLSLAASDKAEDLKVVSILSLSPEELNRLKEGECPELAIEFPANTVLPLHLFLRGDWMSLAGEEHPLQLEVKSTFYARAVQDELLLSADLTEWKPFFEFATGTASIAIEMEDGQPLIRFGAETDVRTEEGGNALGDKTVSRD